MTCYGAAVSDFPFSSRPVSLSRELLSLLGACPIYTLDVTTVAGLLGADRGTARRALRMASYLGLLLECPPPAAGLDERWEISPSIAGYADGDSEVRAHVVQRLTEVMLGRMLRANAAVPRTIGRTPLEYRRYSEGGEATGFTPEAAVAWLVAEAPLVRALQRAADLRDDDKTIYELAERITGAVTHSPPWAYDHVAEVMEEILSEGAVAANSLQLPEESTLRTQLALVHIRQRENAQALTSAALARRIARRYGDDRAEADAVGAEGHAYLASDNHPLAESAFEEALDLAAAGGDLAGAARWLERLGDCAAHEAQFGTAVDRYCAAAQRRLELGDWAWYAHIALKQAAVLVQLGYVEQAATLLEGTIVGLAEICSDSSGDLLRGLGAPVCSPSQPGTGSPEKGRRDEGRNSAPSVVSALRCL